LLLICYVEGVSELYNREQPMARNMSVGPQPRFVRERITFEQFCDLRSRSLQTGQDGRNKDRQFNRFKECGGPCGEFVHKGYVEYPTRYRELHKHRDGPFVRVAQKRSGPYPPAAYPELAESVSASRAATRAVNQQALKQQLSELFQANASSNETIESCLDIKQRVLALQGLTKKIENEHVVDSDDGRRYRQAWALWNTPVEYRSKSAVELTAQFEYHSKKFDCTCNLNESDSEKENASEAASASASARAWESLHARFGLDSAPICPFLRAASAESRRLVALNQELAQPSTEEQQQVEEEAEARAGVDAGAGAGMEADAEPKAEVEAGALVEVEERRLDGREGGLLHPTGVTSPRSRSQTACPCRRCRMAMGAEAVTEDGAEEEEEESSEAEYSFSSCDEAPEDDLEPGRLVCPHLLSSDSNTLGVS
jgi:hypothetical protein